MSRTEGHSQAQPTHHHPAFLLTLIVVGSGCFFLGSSLPERGGEPSDERAVSSRCCGHDHPDHEEALAPPPPPGREPDGPGLPIRLTFEFPNGIIPAVTPVLAESGGPTTAGRDPAPGPRQDSPEPTGPTTPPPAIHPSVLSSAAPMPEEEGSPEPDPDPDPEPEPIEEDVPASPPVDDVSPSRLPGPPEEGDRGPGPTSDAPEPGPDRAKAPGSAAGRLPAPTPVPGGDRPSAEGDPGGSMPVPVPMPGLGDRAPAPPRTPGPDRAPSADPGPRESPARSIPPPADPRRAELPRPPGIPGPLSPGRSAPAATETATPARLLPPAGHVVGEGGAPTAPARIPAARLDGAIGDAMSRLADDLIRPYGPPPPVTPEVLEGARPGAPGVGIPSAGDRSGRPRVPGLIREWSDDRDRRIGGVGDGEVSRAGRRLR